jgi:hypothetical protein
MLGAMKRSVGVGLVLGVAVLVVAVFVLLNLGSDDSPSPRGLGVLAVPEVGETDPGLLDDGHPVFVVHDLDGTVVVIEAVSTHLTDDAMAWCPSSRTIDDVFHGARWDARGRYMAGPGPKNLGSYDIQLVDDQHELVVVAYVDPPPRSQSPDGMAGPGCFEGGYEIHPYHGGD